MKTNLILLGIFVLLLPLCIVQFISAKGSFTDIARVPALFEGFDPERVAIVVIEKPKADAAAAAPVSPLDPAAPEAAPAETDKIAFQRANNDWVLAVGPLRGVKVRGSDIRTRILEPVAKIKLTKASVIAPNATEAELEERGLDPRHATRVQILDANQVPLADLRIGAEASKGMPGAESVSGTFVTRVDEKKPSKQIILTDDRFFLEATEDTWVDKQVLSLDQAKIKSVELTNPKGKLVLERGEDKKWTAKEPAAGVGALREYEVTSLLGRLSNVEVSKYLEPVDPRAMAAVGLEPPEIHIKVKTDDGTDHELRIGNKVPDKNDYYAAVQGLDFLVSFGEWNVTPYQKDPKDFFDPPAPASQPATTGATTTQPTTTGAGAGPGGETRPSEEAETRPAEPATRPSGDGR